MGQGQPLEGSVEVWVESVPGSDSKGQRCEHVEGTEVLKGWVRVQGGHDEIWSWIVVGSGQITWDFVPS